MKNQLNNGISYAQELTDKKELPQITEEISNPNNQPIKSIKSSLTDSPKELLEDKICPIFVGVSG